MKVLVIGASGKTGTHVWQQALAQKHEVSVFVRTASKLEAVTDKVNVISGDVFSADSVAEAITGHDAVIICLGSTGLGGPQSLFYGFPISFTPKHAPSSIRQSLAQWTTLHRHWLYQF